MSTVMLQTKATIPYYLLPVIESDGDVARCNASFGRSDLLRALLVCFNVAAVVSDCRNH